MNPKNNGTAKIIRIFSAGLRVGEAHIPKSSPEPKPTLHPFGATLVHSGPASKVATAILPLAATTFIDPRRYKSPVSDWPSNRPISSCETSVATAVGPTHRQQGATGKVINSGDQVIDCSRLDSPASAQVHMRI